MSEHRYVFVCGLHRSGTSVLFRSIREHPQISGFVGTDSPEDEGMHLQTVYKPSGYYGGAGRFGLHPEAHLTETSPLVNEENRNRLMSEWSRYWDLSRLYLLEKSPPNIIRTRFLQAMLPNSYFIVFMRHPIAVSLATWNWYKKYRVHWRSLSTIMENWLVSHEIFFKEDLPYLQHAHILKYEHFVTDPQGCISDIFGFLGLENHKTEQKVLSTVNEKYFSMWRMLQQKWTSRYQIQRITDKFETRMRPFGYSLVDLDLLEQVSTGP